MDELLAAAEDLGWDVPLVFLLVELARVADVVAQVDLRLQTEEVLGIADMLAYRRGHLVEWLEEIRKDRRIRLEQRLVRLHGVEIRLAGVGVDDHLDTVADVVDAARPMRVRDEVRRCVRVL